MKEIGYRTWGLIPVDKDPATGELLVSRPPMMVITAVDRNASLVFELKQSPDPLLVQVEVTALSAEGHPHPALRVFTGKALTHWREVEVDQWEKKAADELCIAFSTSVRGAQPFLKLVCAGPTLIVSRVVFSAV